MIKFWGSDVQRGDSSWLYRIASWKVAMEVDPTCGHRGNSIVGVSGEGCVNSPYCDTMYARIKSSHGSP